MPAEECIGNAIDAGRVSLATRHALDISGLAVRLGDRAEEWAPARNLGNGAPRQVHARVGVYAIENKATAAQVRQCLKPTVAMHDEEAGVGWPVAMVDGIDRCTEQCGLATVDGLQRVAAHLCE